MIVWMRRHWEAHAYTGHKIAAKKKFKLESLDSAKRWVERELERFARRRSSTG